jgi:AcrR family transcriptional regulator
VSDRRARQAAQTRTEILAAARALFAEQGYATTTVKDVAARAEVSVQTVYDSVGSKAELVRRLNDYIDAEVGIDQIAKTIPTIDDPRALAAIPARIARALVEHCAEILRAARVAAATDPALAALVNEGHRRHVEGNRKLAARIESLGALRPGLTVKEAGATIAAITDGSFALILLDEYQWSPAKIEAWMTQMIEQAVLAR